MKIARSGSIGFFQSRVNTDRHGWGGDKARVGAGRAGLAVVFDEADAARMVRAATRALDQNAHPGRLELGWACGWLGAKKRRRAGAQGARCWSDGRRATALASGLRGAAVPGCLVTVSPRLDAKAQTQNA